jgi:hypothetical protein
LSSCETQGSQGRQTGLYAVVMAGLDERQAYDAMRAFLVAYWERGGRKDDDIAQLLGWTDRESVWNDDEPFDPAMWGDWLDAVRRVTSD